MSELSDLDDLLGKRVRVHLNYGGVLVEGEVIGYYDHPTIVVQNDKGHQVPASARLRMEILPPEPRDDSARSCPRCGYAAGAS